LKKPTNSADLFINLVVSTKDHKTSNERCNERVILEHLAVKPPHQQCESLVCNDERRKVPGVSVGSVKYCLRMTPQPSCITRTHSVQFSFPLGIISTVTALQWTSSSGMWRSLNSNLKSWNFR